MKNERAVSFRLVRVCVGTEVLIFPFCSKAWEDIIFGILIQCTVGPRWHHCLWGSAIEGDANATKKQEKGTTNIIHKMPDVILCLC